MRSFQDSLKGFLKGFVNTLLRDLSGIHGIFFFWGGGGGRFWFHGLVIRVWEYLAFGLWVCSILEFRVLGVRV